MKPTIKLSLLTSTALLLVGCGGGGGNPTTPQRTGSVGDGYIEGAYVCHDSNQDWDCLDEIYATTAANGSFTLSNYDQTKDLLVQVPVGAQDNGPFVDGSTAAKTIASPVWYSYPAGANPSGSPIFVGPLSTLVYAQLHAIPGTTVTDAVNIVSAGLGVDANQTLENYIEDNNTQLHALAEVAGGAIANTTSTGSTPQPNYDAVLGDLHGIANYAATQGSGNYNPGGYTPAGTTPATGIAALAYQAVADIHADLLACNYRAFEEWDTGATGTPREHKELCLVTDADTGDKKLTYTEKYMGVGNNWLLDTLQTSGQLPFLSRPTDTLIDMDHVNSLTQPDIYPLRFFPAVEQSHSGGSAVLKSGILEYKLTVAEADISTLLGSALPKGPSLSPLIDTVTFGAGDKIYKAGITIQTQTYVVDNGHDFFHHADTGSTHPNQFTVYDEGTLGGATFAPMPNTASITTMTGLTDTDFIVDYQDSSNFTKLSIYAPYNPNALNTLHVEHISNGSSGGAVQTAFYEIETHNGTDFLVVSGFYGSGESLFIGKVASVSSSAMIYGKKYPAFASFDVTEGGYQDGDIMDDIMLNTSARDRVLNTAGIAIP